MRVFAPGALALAAAGALAALGVIFVLRVEEDRLIASRLAHLSAVNRIEAEDVVHFHLDSMRDLNVYAKNVHLSPDYPGTLSGKAENIRRFRQAFDPLLVNDLYSAVTLYDRRGRFVMTVPAQTEPPAASTAPAGSPRYLGLRQTAGGESYLDYEAWLKDGSRLVLSVRGDAALAPLVREWPGPETTAKSTVYQRDADALRVISDFRKDGPRIPALRVPLDANTLCARAARGEEGPLLGLDHFGVRNHAVATRIPEFGNLVVTKMSEAEVLAPMREKSRLLWLAAAGFFAMLCSIFVTVARSHLELVRAESDDEKRLLATAIEQAGESIVITDKDGLIIYTNPAFSRASGYTRDEVRGKNPRMLNSGRHDGAFYRNLWDTLGRGQIWKGRIINRRKDKVIYEEDASITPVRGQDGSVTHYIAVKRDISAVKLLEDQLCQSQKMEAIGRLAGGVAHDFNNILTTINGYAEMLAESAPPESQSAADLAEILGAGRRAALLTRQLLTFSRRAPIDPVVVDLRVLVRGIEKMLRRTLGEDVRLALDLPPEPLWVRTDPGQMDQVLMNLAVNARDAMPRGGTLTVRAYLTRLAVDEARAFEVIPAGRYAVLVVTDDGEGMDGSVLSRIFEPFFTTKEKDKGTGLGLSTVFGIVKQNKGHITVDSAPGRGATFTVFLPAEPEPAAAPAAAPVDAPAIIRGDETVLVAEDQSEVLRLVSRALTAQGYRVVAAGGAVEALDAARALDKPIHLLLTDVVMPGMGGEALAANLRRSRPEIKVLFMSGYTDGRLDALAEESGKADLLLKPFTADQVCRRVRAALDGGPPRVA